MALRTRNILSCCAGVGGLELGILLALRHRGEDGRGICYLEGEAAAAASLVASMEAGWFHPAPVWSDMRTFDARPWRGLVHILASGDPCQDNSVAGKRAGADGERFLASEVTRLAEECRPDLVFRENVPGNADGQLAAIAPALEGLGYRVAAGIFSSAGTGNTMRRERLFIMAVRDGGATSEEQVCVGQCCRPPDAGFGCTGMDGTPGAEWRPIDGPCRAGGGDVLPQRQEGPDGPGGAGEAMARSIGMLTEQSPRFRAGRCAAPGARPSGQSAGSGRELAGAAGAGSQGRQAGWPVGSQRSPSQRDRFPLPPAVIPGPTDSRWIDVLDRFPELQPALSEEEAESHLRRGVDAMAHRVERLRATGNGVDPITAAHAFLCLSERLKECRE